MAAMLAALVMMLLATQAVAAQGVVVPLRKSVTQVDPCVRPLREGGYGGAGGEGIQQLEPADSAALLLQLTGHSLPVHGVAYGAGSDLILTKGYDGVGLWDAYSGEEIDFLTGAANAAVSPDGAYVASTYRADDGQIMLHVATADGELYTAPLPDRFPVPEQMQFTPNSRQLVLVQNGAVADLPTGRILVWDVAAGEEVHRLTGVLATLPATATLAARWPNYVRAGQLEVVKGGHAGRITAFAISRDGRLLASASEDGTVRLWDLRTGAAQGCIEVSPAAFVDVVVVAFSPDGREVGTMRQHFDAARQSAVYQYNRWRVADARRQQATTLKTDPGAWGVAMLETLFGGDSAFSPDLTRWVAPAGKAVLLWDLARGDLAGMVRQPGDAAAVAYAPDSATFATAYNYPNDIASPVYGALLWDATHPDLADGAATEKLVLQAIPLLQAGNTAAARPLLRRAAATNPFAWYDPVSDAEVRAGLKEADDGSVRGVVRADGRLNVREAPQADARIITQISDGAEVRIYARAPDGQWLVTEVVDKQNGRSTLAWVMARYVMLDGAVEDLPVKEP